MCVCDDDEERTSLEQVSNGCNDTHGPVKATHGSEGLLGALVVTEDVTKRRQDIHSHGHEALADRIDLLGLLQYLDQVAYDSAMQTNQPINPHPITLGTTNYILMAVLVPDYTTADRAKVTNHRRLGIVRAAADRDRGNDTQRSVAHRLVGQEVLVQLGQRLGLHKGLLIAAVVAHEQETQLLDVRRDGVQHAQHVVLLADGARVVGHQPAGGDVKVERHRPRAVGVRVERVVEQREALFELGAVEQLLGTRVLVWWFEEVHQQRNEVAVAEQVGRDDLVGHHTYQVHRYQQQRAWTRDCMNESTSESTSE